MSDYLEISKLTKIYPTPKGGAVIVKNFDLTIKKGSSSASSATPAAGNPPCSRWSRA